MQVLAGNGASIKMIARPLRISKNTLRKHYKAELAMAREEVIAALGTVVINAALKLDVRVAISWLSRFGGPEWRKTEGRVHGGDRDRPIRTRMIIVNAEAAWSYRAERMPLLGEMLEAELRHRDVEARGEPRWHHCRSKHQSPATLSPASARRSSRTRCGSRGSTTSA